MLAKPLAVTSASLLYNLHILIVRIPLGKLSCWLSSHNRAKRDCGSFVIIINQTSKVLMMTQRHISSSHLHSGQWMWRMLGQKVRSTRHNAIRHDGQLITRFYGVTSWLCNELTGSPCHNPPTSSWLGSGTKYAGLHTQRNGSWNYIHYGIFMQDIVDLGTVAAGNDALLQFLGSRKIAEIATFCPLSRAPFIGTAPNFHRC